MSNNLYASYQQAKIDNPGKYARDLAELLGVSEAELTHGCTLINRIPSIMDATPHQWRKVVGS